MAPAPALAGAPAANISKVKMSAGMILFPKIVFILMKIPQFRCGWLSPSIQVLCAGSVGLPARHQIKLGGG